MTLRGKTASLFVISLSIAGIVFCSPLRVLADSSAYTAWSDKGAIYAAPAGSAYYPSVIYNANGFGSGTSTYAMWYADGNGSIFLTTSTDGVSWGAPATMLGLANAHHPQVLYDADCFGATPCTAATPKYKMWFWNIAANLYDISSMGAAESVDGINWNNTQVSLTQNPSAKLVIGDSIIGWNNGTYGPANVFYQPTATNTGIEPWNYSYVMYYDGTDGSHEVTGLAYSTDGLNWSADAANPVLSGSSVGAWDCISAVYGTVYKDSAGFHYFYSGKGQDNGSGGCASPANNNFNGIGYAFSADGETWVKDATPIFTTGDGVSYRSGRIYTPSVINDGSGILRMYFSAQDSAGDPKVIGYATLTTPTAVLHVIKLVVNGNGSTAVPANFMVHVKNGGADVAGSPLAGAVSPGTSYSLPAGTYTVSEDASSSYAESITGDCNSSGSITLAAGTDETCTIVNTNIPPPATLHVIQVVMNNNSGTAIASDFSVHVESSDVDVAGSPASGTAAPGISYSLSPGAYQVSENSNVLYTQSFSGDCDSTGNITLLPGTDVACTITDTDIPPVPAALHVITLVVNAYGGTAIASDFSVHVENFGVDVVADSAFGTAVISTANDITTPRESFNDGAAVFGAAMISTADAMATPQGSPENGVAAPGTDYSLPPGIYTVSEAANAFYGQSFTGDCNSSGSITLAAGTDETCTIVNTNIPPPAPVVAPPTPTGGGGGGGGGGGRVVPLIGILKVPAPLALTTGAGLVTYNYAVWNVGGQQALDNISVTDDKCGPVKYVSGDINGNGKLDPGEHWKYSCATTLSKTTTNTAVATGYGDDSYHQPGVATAVSTVAVTGAPTVPGFPNTGLLPPLINLVEVPSSLVPLPFGGGSVTYGYVATNIGMVPMSNITVTDNKCAPVSYVSGDANNNDLLDPGETWTYACTTHVSVSATDIATARGVANGLDAIDYAFATVLVSAPGFPNTGTAPLPSQQVKTISNDLGPGSSGDEVKTLQQFLIFQNKGPAAQTLAAPGPTGYFGGLTRTALAEFQASAGIKPAFGNFGPITRAYLAAYY